MRGVGLRVDISAQTDVWQWLKAQKDAHHSVLSKNPAGYPGDALDSGQQARWPYGLHTAKRAAPPCCFQGAKRRICCGPPCPRRSLRRFAFCRERVWCRSRYRFGYPSTGP
ncbi:type VI lipase adapter Tla3 domain-containing protein [Paraburkholderia strydomiana]|uniref:type VI lipase adapter Tla3 domain-containing protein n=1 Tax=Paraburkholderia strydomiana TaxID=1245417 RepID=UPI0038BA49DA